MPTAYGYDVLELHPNQREDGSIQFSRSMFEMDPGTGAIYAEPRAAAPVLTRPFNWFMDGRAAIMDFKTFVAARRGRAVPVWVPSWRADFTMTADRSSGDTTLIVKHCDYAALSFPVEARRYIAIMLGYDTSKLYRKITAAINNGDGTETLTLDSTFGVAVPAVNTVICALRLCRLAADEPVITWHSMEVAESMQQFVELQGETP